jgi:hypothetical protein
LLHQLAGALQARRNLLAQGFSFGLASGFAAEVFLHFRPAGWGHKLLGNLQGLEGLEGLQRPGQPQQQGE